MALTISQPDFSANPVTVVVNSDRRKITLTATAAGETASAVAVFPVTLTDASTHVWTLKSDDGVKAVYTY